MGAKVLLLTMSVDQIAKMSCNPAIGGIGKGNMVREIDALGGLMGKVSDCTAIQWRMLNGTKGPAVWAPRAQVDRNAYSQEMRMRLEATPNIQIKQGTAEDLIVEEGAIKGVIVKEGIAYMGKTVIIASGTFLRGLIHIGDNNYSAGRLGDAPSIGLSAALMREGITLKRLKTGTPPRVHKRSIDYSLTEEQPGEPGVRFSFDDEGRKPLKQVSCHITYTGDETLNIVRRNIHRSALYSGQIEGVGPRYCPSIEDKVVRFADKERHQIFLEPEGLTTVEVYCNGISTSLPFDVQLEYVRSIPALRNAEIIRPAYAIEYDYAISGQIGPTLECHRIGGLFLAGQINGTTGYEEAAAQGLIAGANAVLKIRNQPPFFLKRSEAYIGVMIDDLITKELEEPYRMFTSRAEHRLLLRQDNADLRLREKGYALGLIDEDKYQALLLKKEAIENEIARLKKVFKQIDGKGYSLAQLLARPENSYQSLQKMYDLPHFDKDTCFQIEMEMKYSGYIERQRQEIARMAKTDDVLLPKEFPYRETALRREAQDKLSHHKPLTIGQASRICGITPTDISIVLVALKGKKCT
jgi:tRNA uridine 5-carboxymethylaminomethyl modification enzyme